MKKVIFIAIFALSSVVGFAQIATGTVEGAQDSVILSTLNLVGDRVQAVSVAKQPIDGQVGAYNYKKKYTAEAFDAATGKRTKLRVDNTGYVYGNVSLQPGVNYIDIVLKEGEDEVSTITKIYFFKPATKTAPPKSDVVLWVDQFPAAATLTSNKKIGDIAKIAKEAGFTAIGVNVKGVEGYASYRKNELSGTPYLTATNHPAKKLEDNGFDLLDSIVAVAHAEGLKVYAGFNFFVEGNVTSRDCSVIDEHPEWEAMVQHPLDKGSVLAVRQTVRGREAHQKGNQLVLAFTNPSNKDVQDFQLSRVEEVLKNYSVDGVIVDRCRYDNEYADFSELSRDQFAKYLELRGLKLESFPSDAFTIDQSGEVVKGQFYNEWMAFRSHTIKGFTDRLRALVDDYKGEGRPNLKLASYVGSWYDRYYRNGVNWAAKDFRYDERLNFSEPDIYADNYAATSSLDNFDFLIVGVDATPDAKLNEQIALSKILTNGSVPLLVAINLLDLQNNKGADVVRQAAENSAGLMIFDLSYIPNWDEVSEMMKKAEIVK